MSLMNLKTKKFSHVRTGFYCLSFTALYVKYDVMVMNPDRDRNTDRNVSKRQTNTQL